MASGRRFKYAVPKIDPAEKATRTRRMLCSVFSFNERAYIPVSEKRLVRKVAMTVLIKLDICFSLLA